MTKKQEPAAAEPNIAMLIAMVPLTVRNRVDQLAHREQVSRSEIGRRAVVDYVKRQRTPHADD
jgi:predicted transcriptional regulator